jgi:predicted dehydrogenase
LTSKEINLAVVGVGYWGPNMLRVGWEIDGVSMVAACDRDPEALARHTRRYPGMSLFRDVDTLLADDTIDAVILVTPISTHFDLARRCLLAGKHVLVEKPLASSAEECRQLIELASERGLVLMPGHTFLYSPPVQAVKDLLERDDLGKLHFGTSSRVNLGLMQSDVSVVWDLAPHDFSILLYWLGPPLFLRAIGRASIMPGILDVVFVDMGFADGSLFHVELSWLAPTKLRRTVLVGAEKMVVYEDTSGEQIRIFDRGVEMSEPQTFGEFQLSYRSGDILSPRLDAAEPLRREIEDFVDCVREGREPRSSPQLGLDVVRMLEAVEQSLTYNSSPVSLKDGDRRRRPDRRTNLDGMPLGVSLGVQDK